MEIHSNTHNIHNNIFWYSDDNLTIHHNYRKALESAKEKNRPLFILFTKDGCRWCDRLKDNLMMLMS